MCCCTCRKLRFPRLFLIRLTWLLRHRQDRQTILWSWFGKLICKPRSNQSEMQPKLGVNSPKAVLTYLLYHDFKNIFKPSQKLELYPENPQRWKRYGLSILFATIYAPEISFCISIKFFYVNFDSRSKVFVVVFM